MYDHDIEKLIGIDLVRMEGELAVYGIYESIDGGDIWIPLFESIKIHDLLNYAKTRYSIDTPLVMQQHIQDILLIQLREESKEYSKNTDDSEIKDTKERSTIFDFLKRIFKRRK